MYSSSSKSIKTKGQGLVEYALILVLVAIVVIAALMILGPIIGNTFTTINNSLTNVGNAGQNFGFGGQVNGPWTTAQGATSFFCSSYSSYHGGYNIYQYSGGFTVSGNVLSGYTFVGTGTCP